MKLWIKRSLIALFLLVALLITLNTNLFQQLITGDVNVISDTIGENIPYILLITFVIMLIHNAFPVIPLVLVITINNTLLGFQFGFIWGVFTSLLSAVIVFLSVRFGFQGFIVKRINEIILEKIDRNGFWYVLITRIFPFAPTSIINSMAAVSNIRLSIYTISTLIGNIVIFMIYTVLHAGLISDSLNIHDYVLAGAVIVGILMIYCLKRYKKRIS